MNERTDRGPAIAFLGRVARHAALPALLVFALSTALTYGLVHVLRARLGGEAPPPVAAQLAALQPFSAGIQLLPDLQPVSIVPVSPPPVEAEPPSLHVITGRISRGSTVGTALSGQGVPRPVIHAVSHALRPVFDFRRARAGDFFTLIRGEDDEVLSFEYQHGREKVYRVRRAPSGDLVASGEDVPLERRVVQLAGIVEDSVFAAVTELGEGPDLVHAFADVFVWDVDFSKQVRPGDQFRLLVEKFYDGKGFVRYGRVLAAEYRTALRSHVAVYYEDEAGNGDYFTPEGNSVRRSFLRAPLKYARISSRYTKARLHPILKIRRPHEGVDYAAPTGTPVWSVARGQVIFVGWQGGYGRLVKIRHQNGYVTYYGHLSRYAAGLRVGHQVQQRQVIGYVGSSGLATGPHLDYRVQVNGRFIDPLRLDAPTGMPIPGQEIARFHELRDLRLGELRKAQPAVVLDASL
jgi:murein DD-endopeptidase MepM/ murein hydrolase activator NlpD